MAAGGRALQKAETKNIESDAPVEERIRRRAHEIWLQRGGQDGSDFDDWLQAEQEILGSQLEHTSE